MGNGISGHGITIEWQKTPGGAFTQIGEIVGDPNIPDLFRNEIENTNHDDDIDSYVGGVLRRNSMNFQINFIAGDGEHDEETGLRHAIIANLKTGFRITTPDSDVIIASGIVTKMGQKVPNDGAMMADVSIRWSGRMKINTTTLG